MNTTNQVIVNLITTDEKFKALLKECMQELLTKFESEIQVEKTEQLYNVSDVAKLFQVTNVTVYDWKNKGILAYMKINSRIRFKKSDVMMLYKTRVMKGA